VGSGRCCPPRHIMPFNSENEGWVRDVSDERERRVSVYEEAPGFRLGPRRTRRMTWRATSVSARPYGSETDFVSRNAHFHELMTAAVDAVLKFPAASCPPAAPGAAPEVGAGACSLSQSLGERMRERDASACMRRHQGFALAPVRSHSVPVVTHSLLLPRLPRSRRRSGGGCGEGEGEGEGAQVHWFTMSRQ